MRRGLSARQYGWMVLAALGASYALVVLGGVVRVTGSGLGCPDWPLCHGKIIPPFDTATLIEYSHRLVASVVSVMVIAAGLVAWLWWRKDGPVFLAANGAMGLLVVLVVLGAITVVKELPPTVVTLHLFAAELLLGTLALQYVLVRRHDWRLGGVQEAGPWPDAGLLWLAGAAVLGAAGLMFSGAYVRSTGATFSCNTWPLCGEELLPSQGLPGVHMAHRLVTLVATGLLGVALVAVWRRRRYIPGGGPLAISIAILFALQVGMGAAMVYSGYSQLTRGVHLAIATGVWTGLVALAAITWQAHLSGHSASPDPASDNRPRPGKETASFSTFRAYVALTKPAIIGMLLVTAVGGAFLAASGPPPLGITLVVLVGGALTAGGANALNHLLDRDIDSRMKRTRARPIPARRVSPMGALAFGALLNVVGFLVLMVGANALSALLALATSGFYVLVYTVWLKRSTPQNIVIGGAAGAMPPVVAWAAITGSLALPALYLFLIIFLWTPPHFWALSLLLKDDYASAGVPMLPVVRGEGYTLQAILAYTIALVATTLAVFALSPLGVVYLAAAAILGSLFIWRTARLLHRAGRRNALEVYRYSLLYIALLFLAILVDTSTGFS